MKKIILSAKAVNQLQQLHIERADGLSIMRSAYSGAPGWVQIAIEVGIHQKVVISCGTLTVDEHVSGEELGLRGQYTLGDAGFALHKAYMAGLVEAEEREAEFEEMIAASYSGRI